MAAGCVVALKLVVDPGRRLKRLLEAVRPDEREMCIRDRGRAAVCGYLSAADSYSRAWSHLCVLRVAELHGDRV